MTETKEICLEVEQMINDVTKVKIKITGYDAQSTISITNGMLADICERSKLDVIETPE